MSQLAPMPGVTLQHYALTGGVAKVCHVMTIPTRPCHQAQPGTLSKSRALIGRLMLAAACIMPR